MAVQVVKPWSLRRPLVSIVMGLDQHRAQITAEWLDTVTGVKRGRVVPADRSGARRFSRPVRRPGARGRVGGDDRVAVRGRGASAFGCGGASRRAGGDGWAEGSEEAREERSCGCEASAGVVDGRSVPESWVAPDHILDLRAQVRLRHELGEQRSEWQQRIQATLYHHGCPQRRGLMTAEGREWLASQPLSQTAREQVTVALAMIDALETQIAPIEIELRSFARRQAGCRALMAHYGIGELTAVAILAELGGLHPVLPLPSSGALRRDGHHRVSVRSASRAWSYLSSAAAGVALGAL